MAEHLARWEHWDVAAEYAALLTSDVRLDRASRRAIVSYLERCPRPEAKAALAALGIAAVDVRPQEGPPLVQAPDVLPPRRQR